MPDQNTQMTVEQYLAMRKEAARKIDPKTAEVMWIYALTVDPYGILPDVPPECEQVGRKYFACAPGAEVWVCFDDLPDSTRDALWKMHKSSLVFPAGLPELSLDRAEQRRRDCQFNPGKSEKE